MAFERQLAGALHSVRAHSRKSKQNYILHLFVPLLSRPLLKAMFDLVITQQKWQLLSRELLFAMLSDVLSAPRFLVLVLFFVVRAEFQVAVLVLNGVSVVNVPGRGFSVDSRFHCPTAIHARSPRNTRTFGTTNL